MFQRYLQTCDLSAVFSVNVGLTIVTYNQKLMGSCMTHCDGCHEVGAEAAGLSLSFVLLLDMCSVMFGCTCKVVDFFRFFVFVSVCFCLFFFC